MTTLSPLSLLVRMLACALFAVAPLCAMCGGGSMGGGHSKAHDLDGYSGLISVQQGSNTLTATIRFSAKTMSVTGSLADAGIVGGALVVEGSNGFTATNTYQDGSKIAWKGTFDTKTKAASGTITLTRKDGTTSSLSFAAPGTNTSTSTSAKS